MYNQKWLYFNFTTKNGCILVLQPNLVVFKFYNPKWLYIIFGEKAVQAYSCFTNKLSKSQVSKPICIYATHPKCTETGISANTKGTIMAKPKPTD
jgi:hypothetical protein